MSSDQWLTVTTLGKYDRKVSQLCHEMATLPLFHLKDANIVQSGFFSEHYCWLVSSVVQSPMQSEFHQCDNCNQGQLHHSCMHVLCDDHRSGKSYHASALREISEPNHLGWLPASRLHRLKGSYLRKN